jgi:hypothetical protein
VASALFCLMRLFSVKKAAIVGRGWYNRLGRYLPMEWTEKLPQQVINNSAAVQLKR